jgi:hypothetical protein
VSKPDARFQVALLRSPAFCSFQLARSFFSFDVHARFEEIEFGELLFHEKAPARCRTGALFNQLSFTPEFLMKFLA